jgi:Bacterial Ig-like domain (group 3)/FG-GAP-like repeat
MSRRVAALFLVVFPALPLAAALAGTLFLAPKIYSSGGQHDPTSVAAADVNGDGKLDLVVANGATCCTPNGSVSVLVGNGDGTFKVAQTYNSGGVGASSVAVADVNGDGKPDLLVANECALAAPCGSPTVVGVLLNNGDGTFMSPEIYSSGTSCGCGPGAPNSILADDVNGDGKLDMLVGNICGDNVCSTGGVSVLLGNGDGTFQVARTYLSGGFGSYSIGVADVNKDGEPDLVVANYCVNDGNFCGQTESSVGVLLGNGDGTFQAAQTYPSGGIGAVSISAADVNRDGKSDLLVANRNAASASGVVSVLLGNGDGTFQTAKTYPSGGYDAFSVVVADLNGDMNLDLLVTNRCVVAKPCTIGSVGVLLGNGDGTFQAAQAYSSGGHSNSITAADVNGDGRPDLLVTNEQTCSNCANGSVGVALRRVYPTTTTETTSGSPSFVNQPVTFTAKINSSYGAIPNGETVTFYVGTTQIGTGTTTGGAATFSSSALRAGTHTIKSIYSGDFNFKSSYAVLTQVVELYPSATSLSSNPNPSSSGQTVHLTATVSTSAPGGPSGTVTFKNGSIAIGKATLNAGTATFSTAKLPVGTLSLTATYNGSTQSAKSTSAPVNQVVN